MLVKQLDQTNQTEYKNFVAASASGSFLQSWGWGEFQNQLSRPVIRYGIYNSEGDTVKNLIATVQFLKTTIPHLSGYYLYAPYGPVVSENYDHKTVKTIIEKLISQVKIDFPDCWFIRLEPKSNLDYSGTPTLRIQPGKTLITQLDLTTDELLANMHPKTRYNIKVANKHDVKVESEISVSPQHGFHIAELITLLTQTSDRQKFKSYGPDYYTKLIDFFILHSRSTDCKFSLYKALHNKELVAGGVMVDHGNTRTYLFGGSSDADRNLMAPYALHWQAMQDAKLAGLTNYDWWGIETASGQTPGFVQFKLKWGGKQVSYPPAFDVVNKNGWYVVYKLLRTINRWF